MSTRPAMTARWLMLAGWLTMASQAFSQTVGTPGEALPQKRIYIAEDDHTDFMWSADEDTYAKVFVDMLDSHLKLADETAGNPSAYRSRFNCDGSYWLSEYERQKSPAEFTRLIARIKDGTISAPLNTLVSCYGAQPAEAVLRGLYYSGRLERRYDLRFTLAAAMENQTLPLGLTSLFAGAGARYSWRGICGCASKMDKKGFVARDHEIYWWVGKDGQRLLMKWHSQVGPGIGGYWEAGSPASAIRFVDNDAGFLSRYADPATHLPYSVVGIFGFGGDDLARKTGVPPPPTIPAVPGLQKVVSSPYSDHFHVIAQQQSNAQRQVIVSNEADFFEDFQKTHGATLGSEAVTYGNEWDLYSASMSETSARVKRSVEKLRAAELLAVLVSLHYPDFMQRHTAARDHAFNALGLYWEHDWTADGVISRPQRAAWEEELATEVEYYVQSIYSEALIRLGGMIPRPEKANRFFVVNPLGWKRSGPVDLTYYTGGADVHVRDLTTGQDAPHQIVKTNGVRSLRVLAADVPSAGYKVFEIQAGAGTAPKEVAATVGGDGNSVFENEAVKLVVERDGAIRSFVDKRHGDTELAATIDGLKINDIAARSDEGDPLRVDNSGPVSVTVHAHSDAGLEHSTAITLYRNSDRVDIVNEIDTNFGDVRHWGFSFALNEPAVHTEEVGAVISDKLKSAGGDYATANARYDYLTVNHFADLSDGAGKKGVTISNPDLAFGKLGNSTPTVLDTATPQIQLLAGGQVDGSGLGISAQNGNQHFVQRFALQPHAGYDQTAAMKFALEHQNPLVAGPVISKDGGHCPETTFSLLQVDNPSVLLWALKVHEDGPAHGLVARVWNQANTPSLIRLTAAAPLTSAQRLSHIETPIAPLPLRDGSLEATIGTRRMETFGLKLTTP